MDLSGPFSLGDAGVRTSVFAPHTAVPATLTYGQRCQNCGISRLIQPCATPAMASATTPQRSPAPFTTHSGLVPPPPRSQRRHRLLRSAASSSASSNGSGSSSSSSGGSGAGEEPEQAHLPWGARIEGLSMMQARGANSRRWIAPGTQAGTDGFTFRVPKKQVDVKVEAVDFSVDLGKSRQTSRRWSAARAEASRIIRSSGWRAPKVVIPGATEAEGVAADLEASAKLMRRISDMAPGIGGFGGLYPQDDTYLVANTNGVGMKLKLAQETGIHDTIGVDLVAMAVNEIVTSGAEPLFFLDYLASSDLSVDMAEKIIHGIVEGCRMSNCALLGGETAGMPGVYPSGAYDLSGFVVGRVPKDKLIDGTKMEPGDILIGLQAMSVHTDGYDIIHKALEMSGKTFDDIVPGCPLQLTIGQTVMLPTDIYVPQALALAREGGVKAMAHIAGGGYTQIIPKLFPPGLCGLVREDSWWVPHIFRWLKSASKIHDYEMYKHLNMGIGMVFVLDPHAAHRLLSGDNARIGKAYRLGEVVEGTETKFYNSAHDLYY